MQRRNRVMRLAIALAAGLASTAAMADDIFLKFSGDIVGDSTDPQHQNEIVVLSYSLGVTADSSWTKGGGAFVGKPVPGDFQYSATLNRSVPTIVQYITTGKLAASATLTLRSDPVGNKAGFEYAKYTFEGTFFTNVSQGVNAAGRVVNEVSFVYKTLRLQLFAPGNPTAVSCVLWDIPASTSVPC